MTDYERGYADGEREGKARLQILLAQQRKRCRELAFKQRKWTEITRKERHLQSYEAMQAALDRLAQAMGYKQAKAYSALVDRVIAWLGMGVQSR